MRVANQRMFNTFWAFMAESTLSNLIYTNPLLFLSTCTCVTFPYWLHSSLTSSPMSTHHSGSFSCVGSNKFFSSRQFVGIGDGAPSSPCSVFTGIGGPGKAPGTGIPGMPAIAGFKPGTSPGAWGAAGAAAAPAGPAASPPASLDMSAALERASSFIPSPSVSSRFNWGSTCAASGRPGIPGMTIPGMAGAAVTGATDTCIAWPASVSPFNCEIACIAEVALLY
mmetsp:Transcript_7900/g.9164  ORF Transcript_7900/g.9164 Transcript_7900/m.9164 type:complete len:224 (-) Transcript_7900:1049-1720(-)